MYYPLTPAKEPTMNLVSRPSVNFRDHGYPLRREFIIESSMQQKIDLLRLRMHAQGKYLAGEEVLARKAGGRIYDTRSKWGGPK
jgi:hypothetical protein